MKVLGLDNDGRTVEYDDDGNEVGASIGYPRYYADCEFCGSRFSVAAHHFDDEKAREDVEATRCWRCGRVSTDCLSKQMKAALKSVTEMRWTLGGDEGDKAENILRDLIDLADEVKCAI